MLYVLVNLWTKSDGTTSDKTIVQFRAIKLSFLKRTKSPPPTPYSILFWSKNQHWGIRRGTKTVIVLTMVFMFVRVTGKKKQVSFVSAWELENTAINISIVKGESDFRADCGNFARCLNKFCPRFYANIFVFKFHLLNPVRTFR